MKTTSDEAAQVFRQFAWHLAGKLARKTPAAGKPQGRAGSRGATAGKR